MAQGAYLILKNKTPYRWKLIDKGQYQMNSWHFPTFIEPNSFAQVYIEFQKNDTDGGDAYYAMEGPNCSFHIHATRKGGYSVSVNLRDFDTIAFKRGSWINMGWAHDNRMVFALAGSIGNLTCVATGQTASQWMSRISGEKYLSELTIPGTHDTMTYDMSTINLGYLSILILTLPAAELLTLIIKFALAIGGPIAVAITTKFTQCQTLNLRQQLDSGVRFLDIRLQIEGDKLRCCHGGIKLPFTFSDVVAVCYEFLRQHGTETIIMSIKKDDGDQSIEDMVQREINNHRTMWSVTSTIPKMKDARGKLVLFRRYGVSRNENRVGVNLADIMPDNTQVPSLTNSDGQNFAIQDEYRNYLLTELDHKFKRHVEDYLNLAKNTNDARKIFLNFTSGMGFNGKSGLVYPKTLAKGDESWSTFKGTNKLLVDYLYNVQTGRLGIIPMDFPEYPNNSTIPFLISTNQFE